jgi:chromosomal replication initiation ATPase DnaA
MAFLGDDYYEWIVRRTAADQGVKYRDVISPLRTAHLTHIRALAAMRLRVAGLSFPAIGKFLGGRHHTTVMNLLGLLRKEQRRPPQRASRCGDASEHMCKEAA